MLRSADHFTKKLEKLGQIIRAVDYLVSGSSEKLGGILSFGLLWGYFVPILLIQFSLSIKNGNCLLLDLGKIVSKSRKVRNFLDHGF